MSAMDSVRTTPISIKQQLATSIQQALASCDISFEGDVPLEHPADLTHGDYATSLALRLFGFLDDDSKQKFSNPRALAQAIADALLENSAGEKILASAEVAGPGFINITLHPAVLLKYLPLLQSDIEVKSLLQSDAIAGKKISVEFTDPNPFKQLHIGHAYSNTIGEAISRVLMLAGAEVKQFCYQGDVGMHVAKSLWGMQKLMADENVSIESLAEQSLDERIAFLGKAYALGATAYKDGDTEKNEMQQINYMVYVAAQEFLIETKNWQPQIDYKKYLDATDPETYQTVKKLYVAGREWSMEYFDVMYGRLGMIPKKDGQHFDNYYSESLVGEYGLQIVHEFLAKGVFEESQGAIVFPGEKHGLHTRVFINKLGLPTYEAKELGLAPIKYQDFAYDRSIILTGNEIDEYFKVLLAALSKTNPDLAAKTQHMSHGMVRLPEGKMSSRTGKVLTVADVLDTLESLLQEKVADRETTLDQDSLKEITLGALKYAFLKPAVGGDIAFDVEASVSLTGQSGPYLMYMYVRAVSILEKAGEGDIDLNKTLSGEIDLHDSELALLKQLTQFDEVFGQVTTDLTPHVLAQYLYTLAQSFSQFYQDCPVIEAEGDAKQVRLVLVKAVATVLKTGLWALGISVVERM